MQNKHKVDKESCQNGFDIPACLPTEIDILSVQLMYIRGTLFIPYPEQRVRFENLCSKVILFYAGNFRIYVGT